ncbi:MAG: DUF6430 domain-containing protein [bacterium]|nr:DUF6430 domain-containing protein [bacterium]
MIKRLEINQKIIIKTYFRTTTSTLSLLGLVATFFNIELYNNRVATNILILLLLFITIYIFAIIYVIGNSKKNIFRSVTNKDLNIKYADLFKGKSKIRVIAVNRCFDTVVDDKIISSKSVHGLFIKNEISNMSIRELDMAIDESLLQQGIEGTSCEEKKDGKTVRYPTGTVAEVKYGDHIYYLLGLTKFDSNNNASCTIEEYSHSLIKLMEYYDNHGQGHDMDIPLIGSGIARMHIKSSDLLKYMISLIKVNQDKMLGNINIIIHTSQRDGISIQEL